MVDQVTPYVVIYLFLALTAASFMYLHRQACAYHSAGPLCARAIARSVAACGHGWLQGCHLTVGGPQQAGSRNMGDVHRLCLLHHACRVPGSSREREPGSGAHSTVLRASGTSCCLPRLFASVLTVLRRWVDVCVCCWQLHGPASTWRISAGYGLFRSMTGMGKDAQDEL